jgi:hypothetical protein
VLDDAYNINIIQGMGDRKDTASFSLINAGNKYFNGKVLDGFNLGDNIKIYFSKNAEVDTSTDLVFDGMLIEPPQTIGDNGRAIQIKCKSRTEYLFEALVLIDKQNATPPAIVKEIIDAVNNLNLNVSKFQLNYSYGTSIVTSKSDGSSFSNIAGFGGIYKVANLLLERISSMDFVNDPRGSYIYYVDKNNTFHWTYRGATPSTSTITEGKEPNNIKIQYSGEDVVNMVIVNVGADPAGRGNTILVPDYASITKHGIKAKYVTETSNISHELMQTERNQNPDSFDDASGFYPTDAALSAGYTTYWKSTKTDNENEPTCTAEQSVSGITSKALYLFAVRREAEWLGEKVGKKIIDALKNPRYKVTVELPRTTDYAIGDLITVNSPSHNLNKDLRCVAITHTDSTTELDLEEEIILTGKA